MGILVDRLETRALAIWSAVFQGVIVCALAFAHSLAAILALTLVLGTGVAVSQASEFALVPLLAGSREIGRANGLVESTRSVGFMVGPLIGGALAAGAGIRFALFADAATFLVIAGVLLALPVRRRIEQVAGARKPRARDGLQLLRAEHVLAIVLGAGAVTLVFMSASIPGDFAYVTELGYRDVGIGIVLSVWAIGMIVASNTIPQRIPMHAVATATCSRQRSRAWRSSSRRSGRSFRSWSPGGSSAAPGTGSRTRASAR